MNSRYTWTTLYILGVMAGVALLGGPTWAGWVSGLIVAFLANPPEKAK